MSARKTWSRRPAEDFVTAEEAAGVVGVARSTVYGWVRRKLIKRKDLRVQRHPITKKVMGVWIRKTAIPMPVD